MSILQEFIMEYLELTIAAVSNTEVINVLKKTNLVMSSFGSKSSTR